jgi:putative nucleotidyltransferase with HDIG domain
MLRRSLSRLFGRPLARPRLDVRYLSISVGLTAVSLWLADRAIAAYLPSTSTAAIAIAAAAPVGALPMYTRLALGLPAALVETAALAVVAALVPWIVPAWGWQVLAAGLVGSLLVAASTRRGTVVAAGLWAGAASATVFGLAGPADRLAPQLVAGVAGSIVGGALSGALVLTLSPIAERLFRHVTSLTLLESLSYDHPLLRQLITAAPGTFLHATHLAVLCDAAAPAIAANALELRAGALYHDIGKIRAATFFVENQRGENPHDRLTPGESAAIFRAHVSDGLQLVREYGLGPRLSRFVAEHHGTSVMRSIAAKPGADQLDPDILRYPGPRPQSRETGLLMIADQVEATARAKQPATLDECRQIARETVDRIMEEGQLADSGLGASHVKAIVAALADVVYAIHHRRIAYPEERRA